MTSADSSVQALIDHYREILGLYQRLEELSQDIFDAFQNPEKLACIGGTLEEKIAVVTRIKEESQAIAELKQRLRFSAAERDLIRRTEEELTGIVKRVVDHEDRSRYLFEQRGIRITRR